MKKMRHYALLFVLLVSTFQLSAQRRFTDSNIVGDVKNAKTGEHIPFVTIGVKKTQLGTSTDATGHYFLKNLPTGKLTLQASFVGYKTVEHTVDIVKGKTIELNFLMEEEALSLNEVVVSANRNETQRRLAPTLVSVLDSKIFDLTNASSLSQALNFEPGVRMENNCQNCGFSQVRINGLDGQYSQILIDSRPMFGALAGIYGLEQIPANMIERVEVIRGGGSALYGSSAIGGTINIITKEPLRSGGSFGHTFGYLGGKENSMENITTFNGAVVSDDNKAGLMLFGQRRLRDAYFREKGGDNDDFSEVPFLENRGFGFRSFYKPNSFAKITAEFHSMQEDRRGGDNLHLPEHEVDIAESLKHSVNGANIKYDQFLADGKGRLNVFTAANHVKRNSYYGGGKPIKDIEEDLQTLQDPTVGKLEKDTIQGDILGSLAAYGRSTDFNYQVGAQYAHNFDNLLFMPAEFTVGTEYHYQNLEDITGMNYLRKDSIPPIKQTVHNFSAFLQNEWKNDMWSFLIGVRADKHNSLNKVIVSPRANIRFNPIEDINLRVSYSEGFRAPQYFDEDLHTELAGNTPIYRRMSPNLKEERSRSISGSVDYYLSLGDNVKANFLVEGFYTQLKDRFHTPANDVPDGQVDIRYIENAPEKATVAGVNLEGRFAFGSHVDLQLGATFQKSEYSAEIEVGDNKEEDATTGKEVVVEVLMSKHLLKSPNAYSYFVLSYKPIKNFTASLSGKHTGSMHYLHEAYEGDIEEGMRGIDKNKLVETKAYFDLSCKLAYDINLTKTTVLQINGGVQNITDTFQDDYDTGAGRASAYVYGTMLPRSYFIGTKLSF